jgi:hypothetical protein
MGCALAVGDLLDGSNEEAGVVVRTRATAAGLCGLAAAGFALVVPVLGASANASYSHVSQFISELGSSGAPHARLVAAAGLGPFRGLLLRRR